MASNPEIAELMDDDAFPESEADESDGLVVEMDEDELEEARKIKLKIRKAQRYFPQQSVFSSEEYQNLDKLHVSQVRHMYQDIYEEASQSASPELWTITYAKTSFLIESLLVEKAGVPIQNATANNMSNPDIKRCLQLIELEYGLEQFGFNPTPLQSLGIGTVLGFMATYEANKLALAQQASPVTQHPAPSAPAAPEISPAAQDLINKLNS